MLFSGRVDKGWQGVKNLFKPSFIQEPAHEHMIVMFREVQIDRQKMRQKKRTAVIEQIKQSLLSAINPVPVSRRKMAVEGREREMEKKHFEAFETPVGKVKAVNIQLFRDVPWANVMHFFPSTYVLPATRDLLRVDAVTFVGLMSALVTYIRQSENVWVVGSLVSTFVLYLFRVGFGWRQALVAYNERLAKVRAEKVVGQGRCSVDTLVALACEEAFLEVACVWMAEWGGFEEDAQHIQRAVFQHASLSERSVLKWRAWLVDNGLHHN